MSSNFLLLTAIDSGMANIDNTFFMEVTTMIVVFLLLLMKDK